jgi:hypothetical protein
VRALCLPAIAWLCALTLAGCATPLRAPGAYGAESVALVSLHAPHEIVFHSTDIAPIFFDDALGDEVIAMIAGDTMGDLEALFGVAPVPPEQAQKTKAARGLPVAVPGEAWSQVRGMVAVDVDSAAAPAVLGAVARELGVELAVVVRHEWWMTRERLDIGSSTWGFDRCTILVVNHRGDVVWRESAVGRAPARTLFGNLAFGMVPNLTDEARALARQTARLAWADLRAAYASGPTVDSPRRPAPPSAAQPPPLLEPAP